MSSANQLNKLLIIEIIIIIIMIMIIIIFFMNSDQVKQKQGNESVKCRRLDVIVTLHYQDKVK